MTLTNQKTIIRQKMRELLQSLDDIPKRSERIVQRVLEMPCVKEAHTVFCYLSKPNEVETDLLCNFVLNSQKRLVVPCCIATHPPAMQLVHISSLEELEIGKYGIREPKQPFVIVPPNELDVVFVPGLAFDLDRNRLGRGKGFFDAFLSKLPQNAETIGLAFDCQIMDSLPIEEHDVPLLLVVTESKNDWLFLKSDVTEKRRANFQFGSKKGAGNGACTHAQLPEN